MCLLEVIDMHVFKMVVSALFYDEAQYSRLAGCLHSSHFTIQSSEKHCVLLTNYITQPLLYIQLTVQIGFCK